MVTFQKYRKYLLGSAVTLAIVGITAVSTMTNLRGDLASASCPISPAPFCNAKMAFSSTMRFTKIYVSGSTTYVCATDGNRYRLDRVKQTITPDGRSALFPECAPGTGTTTQVGMSSLVVSTFSQADSCVTGPVSFAPTNITVTNATPLARDGTTVIFVTNPELSSVLPRLYVCQLPVCGNTQVEGNEECDDGNSNNNDLCKNTCTAPVADLSLEKTSPAYIVTAQPFVVSLTVRNLGPETAQKVLVSDIPYAGATFVSATEPNCAPGRGNSRQCTIASLAVGESRTINLTYSMSCSAPIPNTGSQVSAATKDPINGNNLSTPSGSIACGAPLPRCGDGVVNQPSEQCDDGNLVYTDGCSDVCRIAGVPMLFITGKATATTDTAVSNTKNVSLLRFEGRASQIADILLTDLIFSKATSASLVNVQNFALWVDTNDDSIVDLILQQHVSVQSGQVVFSSITGGGYVLPKERPVIFEVHGDISSSLLGTRPVLALRFDTGSTFIQAEQVSDGSYLLGIQAKNPAGTLVPSSGAFSNAGSTAEIIVSTQVATEYTLRNQGDLYVTKSSTPVRSRQLLGGSLADEMLRLQFHAEYEDIDVTDLVLTAVGQDASSISSNVDRLELYRVGETSPFALATVAGCGSTSVPANSLCAKMLNQEMIVQKGTNLNVLVRPRMRTDIDGAVAGKHVKVSVDAATGVKARGLASSNTLVQNDNDTLSEGEVFIGVSSPSASQTITGNDNVVVLSKVTSITNADPNANGSAIPSGTQRAIAQFKFSTAAANNFKNGSNKWTLTGVIFNVNATNVLLGSGNQTVASTSDFKIYNKSDQTMKSGCTANKGSASGSSLLVTCTNIAGMINAENAEIDPGTDATFVLEAEVQNSKISNSQTSVLQVSLQNFTDIQASIFSPSGSHIKWLDKDNAASTSFLWIEYPDTIINGTQYNG